MWVGLLGLAAGAHAQVYPSKPIRLIIPFAAGGGTDITGRAVAQKMAEAWNQSVLVDNRPGANGTIAVEVAVKSPADGYTLCMITSSHSVNSTLYPKLSYDLLRDLAPITQATTQPYALIVHPSVPAQSLKELVALARAKPGTINFGSSGLGGFSHLAGAMLAAQAGIQLTHVPYRGGAPAMADVMGGQIQMLFSTILQSSAQIRAGKLRALAVTTTKRSRALPDVPTMIEAGLPNYVVAGWYGFLAPAKTPRPIIDRLHGEMVRILQLPEIVDRLAADGSEPVGSTPAEFGAHIRSEIARWRVVIEQAGIKAE
ncbi:MAG: tripartite tricarboxylate transporter substrate binding protein [Proteobacteria bacterium]|nr:tripartite tricarboxylate transporter substrate binding protein [Burkholderiales bacterium]